MSELPPIPETEDEAFSILKDVASGWLVACQLEGQAPLVSAANLLGVLYDTLLEAMGRSAVRGALLMVYERSFDEPMSFIERGEAKRLLDQISQARRKVEGKPHLILATDDGKPA